MNFFEWIGKVGASACVFHLCWWLMKHGNRNVPILLLLLGLLTIEIVLWIEAEGVTLYCKLRRGV